MDGCVRYSTDAANWRSYSEFSPFPKWRLFMIRPLFLHVGDDFNLRTTRTAILRADYDVVECRSSQAWDRFVAGDFDGVVMCGSINAGFRRALVKRIAEHSPSTLIVEMGEADAKDVEGAIFLPPFAPELINQAIAVALGKKTVKSATDPSNPQSTSATS